MSNTRWDRVQELFWGALDLSPAERSRFLEARCGADDALRAEVASLLDGDAAAQAKTNGPTAGIRDELLALDDASWVGRRVGPYSIVAKLGHGGMGAVYLAEREDVDKRVALKVVRGALGAPHLVSRFLLERKKYDEPEPLVREEVDYWRATVAPSNGWRRSSIRLLARLYEETGRPEEAAKLRQEEEAATASTR